MKKLLTLLFVLLLTACGGGNSDSSSMIQTSSKGYSYINDKNLNTLVEKVELTQDNWKEYITIISYENKVVYTDSFGDVTGERMDTYTMLGAKTDQFFCFDSSAAIKLQKKDTGETVVIDLPTYLSDMDPNIAPTNLDDYDCVKIQGTLYFLDLPEEIFVEEEDPRFKRWYHESGGFNLVDINAKYIDYDGEYLEEYLK